MSAADASLRIEPLTPDRVPEAARMLARAFVTNPLHVAAFGAGAIAKNEAFFRKGLAVMKGPRFAAYDGPRLCGFIHWVPSPRCQFSPAEKARMVPAMVSGLGVGAAWSLTRWLSAWSSLDPSEPHLHLGPIGVDPAVQGRRIGAQLMTLFCDELARHALPGYLETDRPENVAFYQRSGFKLIAEQRVLGVPNFFMIRRAGTDKA